ncbi:MAG: hypothetical protein VX527_01570 [Planctomycetota bacterium]|nr:hypothetical protein [Planctomycetota bacterium]
MQSAPTCVAILGLASVAFGGSNTLLDQIGPDDGSEMGTNTLASQIFEASFSVYDIAAVDDFETTQGAVVASVAAVVSGWNGYVDFTAVQGARVSFWDSIAAAGASLDGNVCFADYTSGSLELDPNWAGTGALVQATLASGDCTLGIGTQFVAFIPVNEFGSNGQTGIVASNLGNFQCWQANPNGGFGFGPFQETGNNLAYRVLSGSGDPCDDPLTTPCPADVSGPAGVPDGEVSVDDLLTVIGTYQQVGDGTFRPQGDCYPLPNGNCAVNVDDVLEVINTYGAICQDIGACCLSNGVCTDGLPENDCVDTGGSWLGADSTCDDCTSGACCLGDGNCSNLIAQSCFDQGGNYLGDDTDCGSCPALPANNDCSGATDVGAGGSVAVDNSSATTSGDVIDPCGEAQARQIYQDLWYSITATENGTLVVSTCDATTLDTVVAIYDSCDNPALACNDDGPDCANFTSLLEYPDVSSGETYFVRIGSYAWGETASFQALIEVAPLVAGACCVGNTDCFDLFPAECEDFGGVYQGADTDCATTSCGWEGCQSSDTPEGVPCQEDTDAAGANADPNGGLNVDPPVYGNIDVNETICGSASTFTCQGCGTDGADATYRDTDWYVFANADGGSYTVTCGGEGPLLFGIVDLNAGAFVVAGTTDAFAEASVEATLPAGNNYCVWVGHDFNAAFDTPCGTNQDEYSVRLEGEAAPAAACCVGTECVGDESPADCASLGGTYVAGESCATYQCPAAYEPCQTGVVQEPLMPEDTWTAGTSDSTAGYIRYEDIPSTTISSVRVYGLTLFYDGGWGTCTNTDMIFDVGVYEADANSGFPTNVVEDVDVLSDQTAMDLVYAGAYTLKRFDLEIASAAGDLLKVNSVSNDCWFLWMSSSAADNGSSVLSNNGAFEISTFDLNYCITP